MSRNLSRRQRQRKLGIYRTLVEAKLLHGLSVACFTVAEMRRLDGFQSRCLRKILGIGSAFITRISNKTVRERANWMTASTQLSQWQLAYLGRVFQKGAGHPSWDVSFIGGITHPATEGCVRRVGRPRKEWIPTVLKEVSKIMSPAHIIQAAQNRQRWMSTIRAHMSVKP